MKRRTYLEGVLTVNAILLALVLWTLVSGTSLTAQPAVANGGPPTGIPNAASQRFEMIRELKDVSKAVRELRKDLESAEMKVRVMSMPAMRGGGSGDASDDGDGDG